MNALLRTALVHRAKVSRQKTVNVNGNPVLQWVVMAENVPCLLDATDTPQVDAIATTAQITEADRNGRLTVAPEADIIPTDRVTISGMGITTPSAWTVQPYPSPVYTPQGMSHRELRVKET